MNDEIKKNADTSNLSELFREGTEMAQQAIQSVFASIEIVDEISDFVEKGKDTAQSQLENIAVDFDEKDIELWNILKTTYSKIDSILLSNKGMDPHIKIPKDREEFEDLTHLQIYQAFPEAVISALTYTVANEIMSPEMDHLVLGAAGKSRMDILNETERGWYDDLLYNPGFKQSLIDKLAIPEARLSETIEDVQETALKAAEAACYIAGSFGVSVASVFEDAANAVYAPILLAEGNQEKVNDLLLNTKMDKFQAKLDELWDKTGFNDVWATAIKEYGETAAVMGLSVLASSGVLDKIPGATIALKAVILLDTIDYQFVNSVVENGELTFKDILASAGSVAAMFAATKAIPVVNAKLLEYAPKVSQVVSAIGIDKVSDTGKLTGTLVKAALGAVDAGLIQTAVETKKAIRYALGLDKEIDIGEELKNSLVNIVSSSAVSGASYYLKETVINSDAFAKAVKYFTNHEYIAKYDLFSKTALYETTQEYEGGRYRDLKTGKDTGKEGHHTPADSSSIVAKYDGPAIVMDKADHEKTASWGNSKEARAYRQKQKDLINEGRIMDAIQMDIDDIKSKFGGKYDEAIKQMLAYAEELMEKGLI